MLYTPSEDSETDRPSVNDKVPVHARTVIQALNLALSPLTSCRLGQRALIVTVLRNAYGKPSTVVLEYEGSPPRCQLMFQVPGKSIKNKIDFAMYAVHKAKRSPSVQTNLRNALCDLMKLPEFVSQFGLDSDANESAMPFVVRYEPLYPNKI